jgi:hypothetical protein
VRLLVFFVAIVVVLTGAVATLDRIVDPSDVFYSGAPLTAALSSHPPCLLADEIVGGASYPAFKEDLFRRRRPRTIVLGSSRVLKIGAHPGESTFLNMGFPDVSPGPLLSVVRYVARHTPKSRRLTLYLGTELFWFNPNAPFIDHPEFDLSTFDKIRYLLSRTTFTSSWDLVRRNRTLAFRGWKRDRVGRYCVIDRGSLYRNWKPDGTRVYDFELLPTIARPATGGYTADLASLRAGLYGGWKGFDWARLRKLDAALALAQQRGWRVVGFSPPDSTRYALLFSRKLRRQWQTYGSAMRAVFAKHGYPFLDWRDVRSVPCAQTDFVDDGYHPDARCSMRMRLLLDRAARQYNASS